MLWPWLRYLAGAATMALATSYAAIVWGEPLDVTGLPRSARGYRHAADLVGTKIHRLWRQAAEAVAAGFPLELPDGSPRVGPAYRPVRVPTTPSSSTSVKKAAA